MLCCVVLLCFSKSLRVSCHAQVEVEAGGSVEVCVLFKPSCVGLGEHLAHISFTSLEVHIHVHTYTHIIAQYVCMYCTCAHTEMGFTLRLTLHPKCFASTKYV